MNIRKAMEDLTVSVLIGGGEVCRNKESIIFYYHPSKEQYLKQYISINDLSLYVRIDRKSQECSVMFNSYNSQILSKWNENKESFVNANISQDILYLFIILFGKRQLEGILINCQESIVTNRSISYFIHKLIGVLAIPNPKTLKILDVPNLLLSAINKEIGLSECVEIANYLNESEKKYITRAINGAERQWRSYEMA